MWVVESPSPASSGPPTPALAPAILSTQSVPAPSTMSLPPVPSTTPNAGAPYGSTSVPTNHAVSAGAGSNMSGRLSGVVSLTDILNVFAKASGLHPLDPARVRRTRRRSSSSSMRRSVESNRSESVGGGSSVGDLSRRGSVSGRR